MRVLRRFSLGLTILMSVCTTVVFFSCKPLPPKEAPVPRNLTPGLSEALTEFTDRHRYTRVEGGVFERRGIVLLERLDNDEEANNLAGLIEKAFEAGGWEVIRSKGTANLVHGLRCHYTPDQREAADDLISVFKNKGLRIQGLPITGSSTDDHIQAPMMLLEVGLKL